MTRGTVIITERDIVALGRRAIKFKEHDQQPHPTQEPVVDKANGSRPPTPNTTPDTEPKQVDEGYEGGISLKEAISSPQPLEDAESHFAGESNSISVEELSDFVDSDDERLNVIRPFAIEYANSDRSRSKSRSQDMPETGPGVVQNFETLACSSESDETDFDDEDFREVLIRRRKYRRRRRMTSGSIGKRTIGESIGSDTDLEVLNVFLGSGDIGSSARRLRQKGYNRGSPQFRNRPYPRKDDLDDPESDSNDAESHINKTLVRELPYYDYLTEVGYATSDLEEIGGFSPVDGHSGEHDDESGKNSGPDQNQHNGHSSKRGSSSGSPDENQQGSSRSDNEPDGGHDGNNRNQRRRLNNSPVVKTGLRRLACPYQAYEPFQDCFQRGPRNPSGGCDGISRLKQHLSRRHMLSFRCSTCWRSFDTKAKQIEHGQSLVPSTSCRPKPQPESDRFMDARHESDIDSIYSGSTSGEEETWWALFRLLIPGMATRAACWLKANYCPYYITSNFSPTTPSPNFPDAPFSQLGYLSDDIGGPSIFGGLEQTPQSFLPAFATPLPTMPGQHVGMLGPTLPAPAPVHEPAAEPPDAPSQDWPTSHGTINANYPHNPSQLDSSEVHDDLLLEVSSYFDSSLMDFTSHSQSDHDTSGTNISLASGSSGQSSITSISPTLPASASSSTAPTLANNAGNPNSITTQLRLNNERLKARNQRAEIENTELRGANRAARADIATADTLLEELLTDFAPGQAGDPTAGTNMYESLLMLSKLLETASEKLRKAS